MSGRRNSAVALVAGLVMVMTLTAGGCKSSASGGEKVAQGFARTRGHLAASQAQVDETLSAMKGMRITDPTNLSNAFSQYKQAVAGLEKKGKEARQLAEGLQENMEMNTKNWEKEVETIEDPAMKSTAASRRDAVKSNYDQLKTYAQDARAAYDPFLKSNQDIVRVLSMNISPGAVSSLASKMDNTAAEGKTLKEKIAAMERAMDNISKGQPATGGTPAAR